MHRLTTVEIHPDEINFSAGHFTIFSSTEREKMHGHNYALYTAITTRIDENGLSFDYRYYKTKLRELCATLNCSFLLPLHSPHLRLEEQAEHIKAHFDGNELSFLKADVTLLPIKNTTIEELSYWFLQQLLIDQQTLSLHRVEKLVVKVFSSPSQSGMAVWERGVD